MNIIADWLCKGLEWISMGLVAALSSVAALGVVDRYALHTGIGWTEEGARFLLIWASLLAAAVVVRKRAHFAVMVVVGLLPGRVQAVVAIVVNLLGLVILGVLLHYGVAVTRIMGIQRSPALDLPMNAIYVSLPISVACMLFFLVADTLERIGDLLGRRAGAVQGGQRGDPGA